MIGLAVPALPLLLLPLAMLATAAAAAAAAAALRIFLPSFLETGLTLGRSLMAVFCDTSDGADRCVDVDVEVTVVVPKLCDWFVTGIVVNRNALLASTPAGLLAPPAGYQCVWTLVSSNCRKLWL